MQPEEYYIHKMAHREEVLTHQPFVLTCRSILGFVKVASEQYFQWRLVKSSKTLLMARNLCMVEKNETKTGSLCD